MANISFQSLQPEVAGGIGDESVLDYSTKPPKVLKLHYCFYGWLGDDLVTSNGCMVVTDVLKEAILHSCLTGFEIDSLLIKKSSTFHYSGVDPSNFKFYWLKIYGIAGIDDFGLDGARLVVSQKALELLKNFNISNCIIRKKPFTRKQM